MDRHLFFWFDCVWGCFTQDYLRKRIRNDGRYKIWQRYI